MDMQYYRHVRAEIAPLLPANAKRIVDVGCGTGATLKWLRERYPQAHTIALEGNPDTKEELRRNASESHIIDLAGEIPDLGEPDLMLFLDVLEHLPDPAAVLRRLTSQLAQNGIIIVSLPNVAHLSVSLPLLLRGEFTYRDAGILDRTHLRFFIQESSTGLLNDAGFVVDRALIAGLGSKARLLDLVTFGALRNRLAKQYIMRGVRGDVQRGQQQTRWTLANYNRT